jgi:hypothetical protein
MEKVKWLDEYCHRCGEQMNSWDMRAEHLRELFLQNL